MRTMYKTVYENGESCEFTISDLQIEAHNRVHSIECTVNEDGEIHREPISVHDNGDYFRIPSTDGNDDIILDYGTAELLMVIFYHNFTTVPGVKLDKVERED